MHYAFTYYHGPLHIPHLYSPRLTSHRAWFDCAAHSKFQGSHVTHVAKLGASPPTLKAWSHRPLVSSTAVAPVASETSLESTALGHLHVVRCQQTHEHLTRRVTPAKSCRLPYITSFKLEPLASTAQPCRHPGSKLQRAFVSRTTSRAAASKLRFKGRILPRLRGRDPQLLDRRAQSAWLCSIR
jgi:hypothetical protein